MKPQPSFYAILTANVRYDKRINFRQKVLFAEITALTQSKGYCFASNSYFADLYDVSAETISRDVSALRDAGYINVVIDKDAGNQRRIYPATAHEQSIPIDDTRNTPIDSSRNTPIEHTRKHNNTSINNTSINTHTQQNQNSENLKQPNQLPPEDAAGPDFVEVARQMADYFENDEQGKAQWAFMCETKRIKVAPIAITSQWAAKHCDSPYMLKNWRKQTGKIINWIQSPSAQRKPANQSTGTVYEPPKNLKAGSAPARKKVTPEALKQITQNAKYL
jgi:hypothetical protein